MENEISKNNKMKKIIIPAMIGVLILVILIIIFSLKNNKEGQEPAQEFPFNESAFEIDINDPAFDASRSIEAGDFEAVELEGIGEVAVVIPGANPINKDNKVILESGEEARNTGTMGADGAPRQVGFLNPEELPESVLQLKIGEGGFSPSQFTTQAGAPTTFSLTSTDGLVHSLAFEERALSSISLFVGPGQTTAITFNAPEVPGVYNFKCITPGHSGKGETGQLIVK